MRDELIKAAAAAATGGLALLAIESGTLPALAYLWQVLLGVAVIMVIAYGAEWFVDAACRIAHAFGVSHLVIGLTVVAFGTSAPEIAASLVAGYQGKGDITVANVVGSNIFNICFILGGVAFMMKNGLAADASLIRRDGPILLSGTLLLFLFVGGVPGVTQTPSRQSQRLIPEFLNLRLEPLEGVILLVALGVYLFSLYRTKHDTSPELDEERRHTVEMFGMASWRDGPIFLVGLVAVIGGCHMLVGKADVVDGQVVGHGALWFARMWDVPDYVIGVTIIAAGTSAPEMIVSYVAALKGASGLSAGNLIGSDIFNMFGVVGLAGLLLQWPIADPVVLSTAVIPGLGALSVVVLVTILFFRTGMRVSRLEGAILIMIGVARWITDFAFRGAL